MKRKKLKYKKKKPNKTQRIQYFSTLYICVNPVKDPWGGGAVTPPCDPKVLIKFFVASPA